MRLLVVELTRLRWRRAVLLLLSAAVLVPVVLAVVTITDLAPPAPDDYEQAVAEATREAEQPYVAEELERCVEDPAAYGLVAGDDVEATCEEYVVPQPEQYLPYTLDLAEEREGSGLAVAVLVGLIALLVGTTYAGHDWNTGSMSNQLLFETRRLRVWGAKAVAVTLATAAAALLGLTAFWLVLAARFQVAGATIPDGVLLGSLQQGWRGVAVAALAALTGYAITMLSRSTVFTLGLLLGVAVAGGLLISFLVDDPGWVDPTINVAAVIQDGSTYFVEAPDFCFADEASFDSPECAQDRVRSLEDGVVYLGVLTPLVLLASAASFRRRDVP